MLRLALLRHAKSSWDDSTLDDFARPLNARGLQTAPVMGAVLASLNFTPDRILCSPSERTTETLKCIQPSFRGTQPKASFEDVLYLAGTTELLTALRAVASQFSKVLIIGHNPGLHALAVKLAATGDANQIARLGDKFPTASLAVYTFPQSDWQNIDPATGNLDAFITPKDRA
jgi:phosphohistidine phosphatase